MSRFGGLDRLLKALLTGPFVSQNLRTWVSDENEKDLLISKELIESAKVTPAGDRTYALSDAPEAIRYVEGGHTRGKVAITL